MLESPFIAISQYERDLDLPQHTINRHIHFAGDNGAWQKLERGELTLESFYLAFRQGARCRSRCAATHKRTRTHELQSRCAGQWQLVDRCLVAECKQAGLHTIDPEEFITRIGAAFRVRSLMIEVWMEHASYIERTRARECELLIAMAVAVDRPLYRASCGCDPRASWSWPSPTTGRTRTPPAARTPRPCCRT